VVPPAPAVMVVDAESISSLAAADVAADRRCRLARDDRGSSRSAAGRNACSWARRVRRISSISALREWFRTASRVLEAGPDYGNTHSCEQVGGCEADRSN